MLALAALLSLLSAVLAADGTVSCDPPYPNLWLLTGPSCAAAVSQLPPTVQGVDFTVHREGHLIPANVFSTRRPNNPHNLPQSFISQQCEINVDLEPGTDVFVSTWSVPRNAARSIIFHCVLGGDGGPPGRGGIARYDVMVIKVEAFERYLPRYPNPA